MGSTVWCQPCREIEPSQPEEDHRGEVADVSEAPRCPLERLDERVQPLQETVRRPHGPPVEHPVALPAHGPGDPLHLRDVRVHDPREQPVELGGGRAAVRAGVDRPRRLGHRAGPRGHQVLALQRRAPGRLPLGEVLGALEPDVPGPLEQGPLLCARLGLGRPHRVHGPGEQLHDMEAVHGLGGARHRVGAAQGVRIGHVARQLGDVGAVAPALLELVAQPAGRAAVPALRHGDHPPAVEVGHHRYVPLAAGLGGVVYPDPRHARVVRAGPRLGHRPAEHAPYPAVALADALRDRLHGRAAHHGDEHLRLEQGGEVVVRAHLPGHADGPGAVRGAVGPGHAAVHDGAELPDVEVPPGALAGVVDPAPGAALGAPHRMAGDPAHAYVQLLGRAIGRLEPHVLDPPFIPEPHRALEQPRQHLGPLVHASSRHPAPRPSAIWYRSGRAVDGGAGGATHQKLRRAIFCRGDFMASCVSASRRSNDHAVHRVAFAEPYAGGIETLFSSRLLSTGATDTELKRS